MKEQERLVHRNDALAQLLRDAAAEAAPADARERVLMSLGSVPTAPPGVPDMGATHPAVASGLSGLVAPLAGVAVVLGLIGAALIATGTIPLGPASETSRSSQESTGSAPASLKAAVSPAPAASAPAVSPPTVSPAPSVSHPEPIPQNKVPTRTNGPSRSDSLADELGRIDAARQAAPAQGLELLREYRKHHPGGALAYEATVLEIELLVRTGSVAEAKSRAQSLLKRSPKGPATAKLEAIVAP